MSIPEGKYKIISLRDWVPQWFGFVLFLFFAFAFQFTNPTYLSIMNEVSSANQFHHEDLHFALQASLIGMVLIFPYLFRVKFRFRSKHILLVSIIMVMLCSYLLSITDNVIVMIGLSVLLGVFRMMGTFESLSSIQLMVTPTRDFGIFFTFVYAIVLLSIQLSGMLSVHLEEYFSWQSMYHLMIGVHVVMLVATAVLLRPIRFMDPVPFKGFDLKGTLLWFLLFMSLNYIFLYGEMEGWMNSSAIIVACIFVVIISFMLIYSYKITDRPFIPKGVFKLKSVVVTCIIIFFLEFFINTGGGILQPFQRAVIGLDGLHIVQLNVFMVIGILLAAIFCFYWFAKINGSYKLIFFIGFASFFIYHILMKQIISPYATVDSMYLPYVFKGFGYLVVYAAAGKYMMTDLSFELFPPGWFVVAIVRNAVGSAVFSSKITEWFNHKSLDYLDKMATNMQHKFGYLSYQFSQIQMGVQMGGGTMEQAQHAANGSIYGQVYVQSMMLAARHIYDWISLLGVGILIGIALFHFSKPILNKRFGDRFWKA